MLQRLINLATWETCRCTRGLQACELLDVCSNLFFMFESLEDADLQRLAEAELGSVPLFRIAS